MALKALEIKHAGPGMHSDGNSLYLYVKDSGAKSWILRYQIKGKRREMGLGSLDAVDPPTARLKAVELKQLLTKGIDPLEQRRKDAEQTRRDVVTFADVAADYIASHRTGWKNAKHAAQWQTTLEQYALPVIGNKSTADVTTEDVLTILKPIWNTKTETASRVRNRVELVLSYAKAKGFRAGENPAAWRGHLDALLPKPSKVKTVRHHPALPFERVGEFLQALRTVPGSGARSLEMAVLTATRSGEVRLARWANIDLEARVWTIPAASMKAEREHRVPLSDAVVALLESLPRFEGNDLLFPGERTGKAISDMTLTQTIRRMDASTPEGYKDRAGQVITAHGFRSTFRDWAGETTEHAREVVEHALAHRLPDKAEAAYARGTLFDKRRRLMDEWAAWCCTISN